MLSNTSGIKKPILYLNVSPPVSKKEKAATIAVEDASIKGVILLRYFIMFQK